MQSSISTLSSVITKTQSNTFTASASEKVPLSAQEENVSQKNSINPQLKRKVEKIKSGNFLLFILSPQPCKIFTAFPIFLDVFPTTISLKSFNPKEGVKERSSILKSLDRNSLSSRMGVFLIAIKRIFDDKADNDGKIDLDQACGKWLLDRFYVSLQ